MFSTMQDVEVEMMRRDDMVTDAMRQWHELEEEIDAERQSLRRRFASALIQLGVRIDPEAVEDVAHEHAA